MPTVTLPAGPIEYDDSGPPPAGDDAPVVVLLHGLLMEGTVWREVAPSRRPVPEELAQELRAFVGEGARAAA